MITRRSSPTPLKPVAAAKPAQLQTSRSTAAKIGALAASLRSNTPVLLAGETTAKTRAAEAIAAQLNLELLRVDLSAVVSKYSGETEKYLARIFDEAEKSGAVLLLDEADALFGKRTTVKDSNDRHANQEVAYLLQRMETHPGVVIVAAGKADPVLKRRFGRVVELTAEDGDN